MKKLIFAFIILFGIVLYSCQKNEAFEHQIKTVENLEAEKSLQSQPQIVSVSTRSGITSTMHDYPPPTSCPHPEARLSFINNSTIDSVTFADGAIDLYAFRDNFLAQTNKGQDYIYYYYKIGEFIKSNNLISTNNLDIIYTIAKGIEVAKKISNSNNNNEIIINQSTYDLLKNMSAKMHQHPNFNNISSVFTILDSDLEILKGKTKSQFISFYNGGL